MDAPHFTNPLTDRHWVASNLAILNNATMKNSIQISLQELAFDSFGQVHLDVDVKLLGNQGKIARSHGNPIFNFLRFTQWLSNFTFPIF